MKASKASDALAWMETERTTATAHEADCNHESPRYTAAPMSSGAHAREDPARSRRARSATPSRSSTAIDARASRPRAASEARARRPRPPVAFDLAKSLRKAPRAIAAGARRRRGASRRTCARRASRGRATSTSSSTAARLVRGAARRRPSRRPRRGARSSSSTPTSTRTRRRTSGTCATPSSATCSSARCDSSATRSRSRTTSTTPASRSPTSSRVSSTSQGVTTAEGSPRTSSRAPLPRRRAPTRRASRISAGTSTPRSGGPTRRDPRRRRWRDEVLHAIEEGGNETARDRGGRRRGDLLGAPGDDGAARDRLRPAPARERHPAQALLGARLRAAEDRRRRPLETEGKHAGCWVLRLSESEEFAGHGGARQDPRPVQRHRDLHGQGHRLPALEVRPARRSTSTTSASSPRWNSGAVARGGDPGGGARAPRLADGARGRRSPAPRPSGAPRASSTSSTCASPTRRRSSGRGCGSLGYEQRGGGDRSTSPTRSWRSRPKAARRARRAIRRGVPALARGREEALRRDVRAARGSA